MGLVVFMIYDLYLGNQYCELVYIIKQNVVAFVWEGIVTTFLHQYLVIFVNIRLALPSLPSQCLFLNGSYSLLIWTFFEEC